MSPVIDAIERGSLTAKHGFQNEKDVADKFNNWRFDEDAQKWLQIMHYDLQDIEGVDAIVLSGHYKTDVQVQVTIYLKKAIDIRNLQVKLVSNENGFNQIERRRVDKYVEGSSINHFEEVRLLITRYKQKAQCRDLQASMSCVPKGRDVYTEFIEPTSIYGICRQM